MSSAVSVPLEWFLGTIAGMATVIGLLARTVFKVQEDRRTTDLATQREMLAALTSATSAIHALTDSINKRTTIGGS